MSIKRPDTNSRGVAYADGKPHWEVRLRRPDGRQYGKIFATRKAAEAWERGQLTAQATGGWVDPNAGKVPFRERAATYATDRPKALAPKTVELYRKQLDQLILPTFGAVPVSSITTESVRAWLAKVRVECSELQAAKAYRLLRAILNVAVSDGLIVRNPCNIRGAGRSTPPNARSPQPRRSTSWPMRCNLACDWPCCSPGSLDCGGVSCSDFSEATSTSTPGRCQ